jgi:hypothetical protein
MSPTGEPAKPLIHWLHSLPEVQAVLAGRCRLICG